MNRKEVAASTYRLGFVYCRILFIMNRVYIYILKSTVLLLFIIQKI